MVPTKPTGIGSDFLARWGRRKQSLYLGGDGSRSSLINNASSMRMIDEVRYRAYGSGDDGRAAGHSLKQDVWPAFPK